MPRNEINDKRINEKINELWYKLRTANKKDFFQDMRDLIEDIANDNLNQRNSRTNLSKLTLCDKINELCVNGKIKENFHNIRMATNVSKHSERLDYIESIKKYNEYSKIALFILLIPILKTYGYKRPIHTDTITEPTKLPFLIDGKIYTYNDELIPNIYKCSTKYQTEPGMPESTQMVYISEANSHRYDSVCDLVSKATDNKELKNQIMQFSTKIVIIDNQTINVDESQENKITIKNSEKFLYIVNQLTTLKDYCMKTNLNMFNKLKIIKNLLEICQQLENLNIDKNKKVFIAHRLIRPETVFIDENLNVKLGFFNIAKLDIENCELMTSMNTENIDNNNNNYHFEPIEYSPSSYLPPWIQEQKSPMNITTSKRVDLYSIMMIFCELVSHTKEELIEAYSNKKVNIIVKPKWYTKDNAIPLEFYKYIGGIIKSTIDSKNVYDDFLYSDVISRFDDVLNKLCK